MNFDRVAPVRFWNLLREAGVDVSRRTVTFLIVGALCVAGLEALGGTLLYKMLSESTSMSSPVGVGLPLWLLGALVVVTFAARASLFLWQSVRQQRFVQLLGASLTEKLVSRYSLEPYRDYLRHDRAAMQQHATSNTVQAAGNIAAPAVMLATDSVQLLAIALVVAFSAPLPALLAAAIIVPALSIVLRVVLPRAAAAGNIAVDAGRDGYESVGELVSHMRDVRLFAASSMFVERITASSRRQGYALATKAVVGDVPRTALDLAGVSFLVVVAAVVSATSPSTSELVGAAGLLGYAVLRMMPIAGRTVASMTSIRFAKRALSALEEEFSRPYTTSVSRKPETSMECIDVSCGYADMAIVVESVSLKVNCGESLAIVGPSGSGKSTLLDTLVGLLPPLSGQVLWDGEVVEGVSLSAAVVSQSPVLFVGTVRDNVCLDRTRIDGDDDEVWESLRLADLDSFVHNLPGRLDTVLGYGGVGLSGGQRQRLAIARAIYTRSSVLVFDEGTSSLDEESARRVVDALWTRYSNGIIIASTHSEEVRSKCSKTLVIPSAGAVRR